MSGVTGQILSKACADGLYVRCSGVYFRAGAEERFPGRPEELLSGGRILKDSRSVVSGLDREQCCFVKKYKKNGFWRTLKRALLYPRSHRCLAAALRLREIGVDTPEVLLASRYCLITEVLAGVRYLPECPEAARAAVGLLAKLHDGGVRHGDFNLRNIYRTEEGRWGVIDLDGSRLYAGPVPDRVRFLELARLISSYLKCISGQRNETAKIAADFASDYYRITRYDLYGKALLVRVMDLAARR